MISKTCVSCGKIVPVTTKPGDKCPHCGVEFAIELKKKVGFRWDILLKILPIIGLVGAVLAMPVYLMKKNQNLVIHKIKIPLQQGSPAERLAAAQLLIHQPFSVIARSADDYISAMTTTDDQTHIALIHTLVQINQGIVAKKNNRPTPRLPQKFIEALKIAAMNPTPGIREAALQALQSIGVTLEMPGASLPGEEKSR